MGWFRNLPVLVKLTLAAVLALVGVVVMATTQLVSIRPSELDARQVKIRNLVEVAVCLIADYQRRAASGVISEDVAKRSALAALATMRYDQADYFWVNDMTPRMIMHPTKPDLDGTDLTTYADPTGKRFFVEFVKVVQAKGAGFIEYRWPKPGHGQPVPKLSYVAGFAPWGWIIGTGIYLDDVDIVVAAKVRTVVTQATVIVVGLLMVLLAIGWGISRPLRRLTVTMRRLAAGDTEITLVAAGRDEIGQMTRAVGVLRESLAAKQALEADHAALRRRAADEHRQTTADLTKRLETVTSAAFDRIGDAAVQMQHAAGDLSQTTECLVTTVADITAMTDESAAAARHAAQEAAQASSTITSLTSTADTIGGVIAVIRTVADQTNLLALNATIEAARAGELGKGFAVVAGEVKDLAQQSAQASDRIADEVEAIQDASKTAAAVLGRLAETVQALGAATDDVACTIMGRRGDAPTDQASIRSAADATEAVARHIQHSSAQLAVEAQQLRKEFHGALAQLTD